MTDKDVERNHVLAKRVLAVLMDRFEHGRSPEGNRVIWKAYEHLRSLGAIACVVSVAKQTRQALNDGRIGWKTLVRRLGRTPADVEMMLDGLLDVQDGLRIAWALSLSGIAVDCSPDHGTLEDRFANVYAHDENALYGLAKELRIFLEPAAAAKSDGR